MWTPEKPKPVRLIVAMLGADQKALVSARDTLAGIFGRADLISQTWPFSQTDYYAGQTGDNIIRQFMSFERLIDPGTLAAIKHTTNRLEQQLAGSLCYKCPRPVNLDPGIIESSKLVLASTKNFAHRIYIGDNIYAEITLYVNRGQWTSFPHTFPDYKQGHYFEFFDKVRERLNQQLRQYGKVSQSDK